MRTKALILTAAALAAGVASSMAQSNVYSLNIVGYVNVPVTANQFIMLANPFDDGAGDSISNVFASFNANAFNFDGSSVFTFSQGGGYAENDYSGTSPTTGIWSSPAATLPPGQGFWLFPAGSGTVTFTGSVVLSNSVAVPSGFAMIGSSYPASTNLVGLGMNWLASNSGLAHDGDSMFRFNVGTQSFNEYDFSYGFGWSPGSTNGPTLSVGEGFFYYNANNADTWTQNFTVN